VREAHPRLRRALRGTRAARGGDRGAQPADGRRRVVEVERGEPQRAQRDRRRLVVAGGPRAGQRRARELARADGVVAEQAGRLVGERGGVAG
jgi:hypothetical protein